MLPRYAFSEEVDLGDEGLAPNIDDVRLLIALTELRSRPSCGVYTRHGHVSIYSLYDYYFYFDRIPLKSGAVLSLRSVVSNFNTHLSDRYKLLFASFFRSPEEPPPLHPTLWVSFESANLVRENFKEGQQDALGVRLVHQTGFPIYHLFAFENRKNLCQLDPKHRMRTTVVGQGQGVELIQPDYGIELAQFNLPGRGEELNFLFTIRDMLDQLGEFYEWVTNNTSEI